MYQTEHPLLTFLVLAAIGVASATASSGPALADPAIGRTLASQCAQCHGTNGNAVGDIDDIAGESANSMYNELIEMKRETGDKDIMHAQVRAYSNEQLRVISEYLATVR